MPSTLRLRFSGGSYSSEKPMIELNQENTMQRAPQSSTPSNIHTSTSPLIEHIPVHEYEAVFFETAASCCVVFVLTHISGRYVQRKACGPSHHARRAQEHTSRRLGERYQKFATCPC